MNTNLLFDFSVNKENKSIHVKREFAAGISDVWNAWTNPQILDLWWAPKPYRVETKSMDFKEGGTWLYAMISPEDVAHWCKADYQKIEPFKEYAGLDAFCDEEGNVNSDMPRSLWNVAFTDQGESTVVDITITYKELADLERIIEMGFKEGFTMAMGNLDEYFAQR